MKREYIIKHEPVTIESGVVKDKWNIYYYINGELDDKQFYSTDGTPQNVEIKNGYTEKI